MAKFASPRQFFQELIHLESPSVAVASLAVSFPPERVASLLSGALHGRISAGQYADYCKLYSLVSKVCYSDAYFSVVFPVLFDLLLALLESRIEGGESEILDLLTMSWNVLKRYEAPDSLFQSSAYRPAISICQTRSLQEILHVLCDYICRSAPMSRVNRAQPLRSWGENPDNCSAAAANLVVELLVQPEIRYSTSLRGLKRCGSAAFASFGDIRGGEAAVRAEARAHLSILKFISSYARHSVLISEIVGELLSFSPLVGHASREAHSFAPIPTVPEHIQYYPYLNSLCLGCLSGDASGPAEEDAVAGMTDASFSIVMDCVDSLSHALSQAWADYNSEALVPSGQHANQRADQGGARYAHLQAKRETFFQFSAQLCLKFLPLLSRLALASITHMAKGRATDPMTQQFVENDDILQALSDVRYRYSPTEAAAISVGGFYPSEVEAAQLICTGPGSLSEPSQFPFVSPFSTLSSEDCVCSRLSAAILGEGSERKSEQAQEEQGRCARQVRRIYTFSVTDLSLERLRPPLSRADCEGRERDILQFALELFTALMSSSSLSHQSEAHQTDAGLGHAGHLQIPLLDQARVPPSGVSDSPQLPASQPSRSASESGPAAHLYEPTGVPAGAPGRLIPHSAEQTAESTVSSDLGISLTTVTEKLEGVKAAAKLPPAQGRTMPPVAVVVFRALAREFTSLSSDMLSGRVTAKSVLGRYAPFLLNAASFSFAVIIFLQAIVSHFRGMHQDPASLRRRFPLAYPRQKRLDFLGALSQSGATLHQLRIYIELGGSLSHNLMLLMEREKLHKSAHEQAAFLENKDHLCIADQMPKPGFFSPAPRIPGELYTLPDLRTAFLRTNQPPAVAPAVPAVPTGPTVSTASAAAASTAQVAQTAQLAQNASAAASGATAAVATAPTEQAAGNDPANVSADALPPLSIEAVARQFTANVMCIFGLPDPGRVDSAKPEQTEQQDKRADDSPEAIRRLVVSSLATDQRMIIGLTNAELSTRFTTTLLRHWDFQEHECLLFSALSVYYLNLYSLSLDSYQILQEHVQFTRRTEPDLAAHTGQTPHRGGGRGREGQQAGRKTAPGGLADGTARDSKYSASDSTSGYTSAFSEEEKAWDPARGERDTTEGESEVPSQQLDSGLLFRLCEATPTACMLAAPRQLENSSFSLRHYATLLYAPVQHGVERMELGSRLARAALGRTSPLSKALKKVTGSSVYPAFPSVLYLPCIRTSAYRESVLDIISQRPSAMGLRFGDVRMAMSYDVLLASERVWGCRVEEMGALNSEGSEPAEGATDSASSAPLFEGEVQNPLLAFLARRMLSGSSSAGGSVCGANGEAPISGPDVKTATKVTPDGAVGDALQREARNSTNLRLLLGSLYSDDFLSVRRASSLTAVCALPALSQELPTVSPYKVFAVTPILAGTVDTYAKALTASAEVGVWDEGAFLDLLTFMQPKLVSTFSRLHSSVTCPFRSEADVCARRRAVIDLNDAFTPDPTAPGGYRLTAADLQRRVFHSASQAEIHQTMPPMEPRKLMAAQFLTSVSFILHSKPAYMYNDPMMSLLSFLLRTLGHFPALHEVEDIVDVLPTLILISRCLTLMPTTELAVYLAFFGNGGTRPVSSEGRRVFAEAVADVLLPEGSDGLPPEEPAFPFDVKVIPSVPAQEEVVDASGSRRRVPVAIKASTLLPTDKSCFLDPNTQRVTVYSTESCVFYSLPLRIFLAARWYFRALLSAQVMLVVLLRGMDGTTMLGSILQGSLNTGPRHRRTYLSRLFLLAFSVYSQACVSQLGLLYPPELPRLREEGEGGTTGQASHAVSTGALHLTADPWEFASRFRDLIIGPLGGIVSGIIADTLNDRIRSGGQKTRVSPATSLAYRCLDMQNLSHLTGELAGKYLFYQASGYIDPRLFGATPACYTLLRPFNSIAAAYLMSNHGFSLEKGQAHLNALMATLPPPFLHLVEEIRRTLGRVHSDILIVDEGAPDQSFQEFHFFVSLDQILASWLLCGGLEAIERRERFLHGPRGGSADGGRRSGPDAAARAGARTESHGQPLPTRRDMERLADMFCLVKSKYLLQQAF